MKIRERLGQQHPPLPLPPHNVNPFSFENFGNGVLLPALALMFSGNLHSVQDSGNCTCVVAFGIHLFDGGNGSQFGLMVYDLTLEPAFAVSSPPILGKL